MTGENRSRVDKLKNILSTNYDAEDLAASLTDLLADVRHFADSEGLDLGQIDRLAYSHYCAELNGEAAA